MKFFHVSFHLLTVAVDEMHLFSISEFAETRAEARGQCLDTIEEKGIDLGAQDEDQTKGVEEE